jgi:hypothetical protein
MAHFVFVWELGGGYGDVATHLPVIDAPRARIVVIGRFGARRIESG